MPLLNDVYDFCLKAGYKPRVAEPGVWIDRAVTTKKALASATPIVSVVKYCISVDEDNLDFFQVVAPARLNRKPTDAELIKIYELVNRTQGDCKVAKITVLGQMIVVSGEAYLASEADYKIVLRTYLDTLYMAKQLLADGLPMGLKFDF